MPHYAGIAGATNTGTVMGDQLHFADDLFPSTDSSLCCLPHLDGRVAAGGVLIPNRTIAIRDITDGSSNTIVVGEISSSVLKSGVSLRVDAGNPSGWAAGTVSVGTPPQNSDSETWPAQQQARQVQLISRRHYPCHKEQHARRRVQHVPLALRQVATEPQSRCNEHKRPARLNATTS